MSAYVTIETVTRQRVLSGVLVESHEAVRFDTVPYRLGKRAAFARLKGLAFVKALAVPGVPRYVNGGPGPERQGVVYVGVFDSERRLLAAWSAMESGLSGMTGTSRPHTMLGGKPWNYKRKSA